MHVSDGLASIVRLRLLGGGVVVLVFVGLPQSTTLITRSLVKGRYIIQVYIALMIVMFSNI